MQSSLPAGVYQTCASFEECGAPRLAYYYNGPVMRTTTITTPDLLEPRRAKPQISQRGMKKKSNSSSPALQQTQARKPTSSRSSLSTTTPMGGGIHHHQLLRERWNAAVNDDRCTPYWRAETSATTPFALISRPPRASRDQGVRVRAQNRSWKKNTSLPASDASTSSFFPEGIDSCFNGGGIPVEPELFRSGRRLLRLPRHP